MLNCKIIVICKSLLSPVWKFYHLKATKAEHMDCIKEICYLRSQTDRISLVGLLHISAPSALLFNRLNVQDNVLKCLWQWIPSKKHKSDLLFINIKLLSLLSPTVKAVLDLVMEGSMKTYNLHYCTSEQISFPEIPTQYCKYIMLMDWDRWH